MAVKVKESLKPRLDLEKLLSESGFCGFPLKPVL